MNVYEYKCNYLTFSEVQKIICKGMPRKGICKYKADWSSEGSEIRLKITNLVEVSWLNDTYYIIR